MLTQEHLAERARVSVRAISDLERGIYKTPRHFTLLALEDALGLDSNQRQALETAARQASEPAASPAGARPPHPLDPLLGRSREIALIERLLTDDRHRLVTLTGPGGVGKTRIAIEVSHNLESLFDRIYFIDLSSIAQATLVPGKVASLIGVKEKPGYSAIAAVAEEIDRSRSLLLMDNFEHLLDAVWMVSELLGNCVELRVLATSRARLRLRGEREIEIAPFEVPASLARLKMDELSSVPVIRLFVERAQAVDSRFALDPATAPHIVEICRKLDGLPLAIELAAPKIKMLPLDELLTHLDHRLPMLVSGERDLPTRHRTIKDTIDWSHNLLSVDERALFRRLAVFSGGASVDAIASICLNGLATDALQLLNMLIEDSLIRQTRHSAPARYDMLETVREYAMELLTDNAETATYRRRHAEYFMALVERAEPQLRQADQIEWLERLELEHDNLRAALGWASQTRNWEIGLRIASALARFWDLRGYLSEGRYWLDCLLNGDGSAITRARALNAAGSLARSQGDVEVARRYLTEALEIHRCLDNVRGSARVLNNLGALAHDQGDFVTAIEMYHQSEACWNQIDDQWGRALAFNNLGAAEHSQHHLDRAEALHRQSLQLRQELGDIRGIAESTGNLANVARDRGVLPEAARRYFECFGLSQRVGDLGGMAIGLEGLAFVAWSTNRHDVAARLIGAADALRESSGTPAKGTEARHNDRLRSDLRRSMSGSFEAELDRGRTMPLDDAIAESHALIESFG